jgi:hypothetical protein
MGADIVGKMLGTAIKTIPRIALGLPARVPGLPTLRRPRPDRQAQVARSPARRPPVPSNWSSGSDLRQRLNRVLRAERRSRLRADPPLVDLTSSGPNQVAASPPTPSTTPTAFAVAAGQAPAIHLNFPNCVIS